MEFVESKHKPNKLTVVLLSIAVALFVVILVYELLDMKLFGSGNSVNTDLNVMAETLSSDGYTVSIKKDGIVIISTDKAINMAKITFSQADDSVIFTVTTPVDYYLIADYPDDPIGNVLKRDTISTESAHISTYNFMSVVLNSIYPLSPYEEERLNKTIRNCIENEQSQFSAYSKFTVAVYPPSREGSLTFSIEVQT